MILKNHRGRGYLGSGYQRRWVELEWLRARPTPKAFRVTEESIAEFKKRYVSLPSIARTTSSASWALRNICKRRNLSMLVAAQPDRRSSQAFIRAGQRQELLGLRIGPKPEVAIACTWREMNSS